MNFKNLKPYLLALAVMTVSNISNATEVPIDTVNVVGSLITLPEGETFENFPVGSKKTAGNLFQTNVGEIADSTIDKGKKALVSAFSLYTEKKKGTIEVLVSFQNGRTFQRKTVSEEGYFSSTGAAQTLGIVNYAKGKQLMAFADNTKKLVVYDVKLTDLKGSAGIALTKIALPAVFKNTAKVQVATTYQKDVIVCHQDTAGNIQALRFRGGRYVEVKGVIDASEGLSGMVPSGTNGMTVTYSAESEAKAQTQSGAGKSYGSESVISDVGDGVVASTLKTTSDSSGKVNIGYVDDIGNGKIVIDALGPNPMIQSFGDGDITDTGEIVTDDTGNSFINGVSSTGASLYVAQTVNQTQKAIDIIGGNKNSVTMAQTFKAPFNPTQVGIATASPVFVIAGQPRSSGAKVIRGVCDSGASFNVSGTSYIESNLSDKIIGDAATNLKAYKIVEDEDYLGISSVVYVKVGGQLRSVLFQIVVKRS